MATVGEIGYGSDSFNMFRNTEPLDPAKSTLDYYLYMPRTYGSNAILKDIYMIEIQYKDYIMDLYSDRFKTLFLHSSTRSMKDIYVVENDIPIWGIIGTFDLFRSLFSQFPAQYLPLIQPFELSDDFIDNIIINELTESEIDLLLLGSDPESNRDDVITNEINRRKALALCTRLNGVYDMLYNKFIDNIKELLSFYPNNKDIIKGIIIADLGIYEKGLIKRIYNNLLLILELLVYSICVKPITDLANFTKIEVEENTTIISNVTALKPEFIVTSILNDVMKPDNTGNISSIKKHISGFLFDKYLTAGEKLNMNDRYNIMDPYTDNITIDFEEPNISDLYLSLGQTIDNIRTLFEIDSGPSNIYGHEMNRFLRVIAGFDLLYVLTTPHINKISPKNIFEQIYPYNTNYINGDSLKELIDLNFIIDVHNDEDNQSE